MCCIFFLHPVVPAVYTHGKIIHIDGAIGIQRRVYHKKIYMCSEQYADNTGRVHQYIIFSGIPYTYNLRQGAYPLLPLCLLHIADELLVYIL